MSVNIYQSWFDNYTGSLIEKEPSEAHNYQLKVAHTYRVVEQMERLAEELALTEHEQELSRIIGLFHDVGRFVQYHKFGTFSEGVTGSHATLSVNKLKKDKVLHTMPHEDTKVIFQAIEYHNHLELPQHVSDETYKLGVLLRDADKLDALYLQTCEDSKGYTFKKLSEDSLYSDTIIQSILESKQADFRDIQYTYDRDLSILAMIFDFKLKTSFKILLEEAYIDKLFQKLPDDTTIQGIKDHCLAYVRCQVEGQ